MGKFRVAERDDIGRDELRPYAVRWVLFASAIVAVLALAAVVSLVR
jgi:hypothetical protein